MKKTLFTVMLCVVSMATISSAYAESGPPPLQEVDATGQGANADDAFKQAVNDAVRQVVGTLVSAENVINNERVIRDEVLTLSNGYVEKVLNQDKTKLDDGTWQVKLKCIVRKGQLYGKLQEVKVPTLKFDGLSMFASVVSQSNFRSDAHKRLAKAVRDFFRGYPSVYKYECEKPELVHAGDGITTLKIKYRCNLDEGRYYDKLLPPLSGALKQAAQKVLTLGPSQDPDNIMPGFKTSQGLEKVIVQERSGWSVYGIEEEILKGCDLREAFWFWSYRNPLIGTSQSLILFQSNGSPIPLYITSSMVSDITAGHRWAGLAGRCVGLE